ncbi:hypothetical protein TIFTF001_015197 [Ficus carica]|uniref:Uncharacterized protein n=1 Tax=Ficus carica TaxID=3494 RepID=A0AA88AL54_FICCA|nr:hypothetical protein TIFTF001_015197 [Ficus carica]
MEWLKFAVCFPVNRRSLEELLEVDTCRVSVTRVKKEIRYLLGCGT